MMQGLVPIRRRGDGRLQHFLARPGTIALSPNGVYEDKVHLSGDVGEAMHLFLPEPLLKATAIRELDVDPDKIGLHYDGGFHDPLIEQIAVAIRREIIDPVPTGRILIETLSVALSAHTLRHHSNLNPASVSLPFGRGALDLPRLQRVMEFIEAHLAEDMSLEQLAKEACLSPFHFARAFKAATEKTPHGYVTERRIEKAKSLLSEGRLSLAEISYLSGFSSQAYFTKWFNRLVDTTPGAYRRSARSFWTYGR